MSSCLSDRSRPTSSQVCDAVRAHMQARFGLRHDGRERLAAGIEDAARILEVESEAIAQRVGTPQVEAVLLSTLTTPESYFFRQPEQLAWVFDNIVGPRTEAPVRIWSAGCARGEEPYSIAMLAQGAFGRAVAPGVSIVGSDVNGEALCRAREASYRAWSFRGVDEHVRRRFFTAVPSDRTSSLKAAQRWTLRPQVRNAVRFAPVNLAQPDASWPQAQDVVFCRNVLLYLDAAAFVTALDALHRCLRPGGVLVVSSAEAPFITRSFRPVVGGPIGVFEAMPPTHSLCRTAQETGAAGTPTATPQSSAPAPAPRPAREHTLARVYTLANRGLAARAMETVTTLLGEHPLFAEAYLARAILHLERGAEALARADLGRARRLLPSLQIAKLLEGRARNTDSPASRPVSRNEPGGVDPVELASLQRTLQRLDGAAQGATKETSDG